MAAMSTVLTEFTDNGDSRTYVTSGHTISNPKLVIMKRRVPTGNQKVSEVSFSVVHATEDADSLVIPERVSLQAISRFPILGDTADRDAALAIFRDIVASDEFGVAVASQIYFA